MTEEKTQSSNKQKGGTSQTERLLLLLKSSKGLAAAGVIQEALKAPGIYSFTKFINHPNVLALKGSSHEKWVNALDLFAYKTYDDYINDKNNSTYPKLDEKQLSKLKQLTIVTYAAQSSNKILLYNDLQKQLNVKNVRDLEDMIILCIYDGLIRGRLNQSKNRLEINAAMGRDISPNDIKSMKSKLNSWLSQTDILIDNLNKRMKEAKTLTTTRQNRYDNAQSNLERLTQKVFEKQQQEQYMVMQQMHG